MKEALSFFILILAPLLIRSAEFLITFADINAAYKIVSESSNYDLRFQIPIELPVGSQVSLDFGVSLIQTPSGSINTCNSAEFTTCACASKKCTMRANQVFTVNTIISISLGPMVNPPFIIQQTLTLRIDYNNGKGDFSSRSLSIPSSNFLPGSFSTASLVQSSLVVQQYTDYIFTLWPNHNVSLGSQLVINFPDTVDATLISNIYVTIYGQSERALSDYNLSGQDLTINDIFYKDYSPSKNLEFILGLKNIGNPGALVETESFQVSTRSSTLNLIDQIMTGMTAKSSQPGKITIVSIDATSTQINDLTAYTVVAWPVATLATGGRIQINFPPQIRFDQNQFSCQAMIGLQTSSSTYYCTLNGNIISTQNLYYSDTFLPFFLKINGVINPDNTGMTDNFVVQTIYSNNLIICQTKEDFQKSFTSGVIKLESDFAASTRIAGEQMSFNISFSLENSILKGSSIQLKLSKSRLIKDPSNDIICKQITVVPSQTGPPDQIVQTTIPCFLSDTSSSFLLIQFTQFCTSSSDTACKAGYQSKFFIEVTSGLMNIAYISTEYSLLNISTLTPSLLGMYDSIELNNQIPSLLPAALGYTEVAKLGKNLGQTNAGTGDLVDIVLQITVGDYFLNNEGNFLIEFERDVVFYDSFRDNNEGVQIAVYQSYDQGATFNPHSQFVATYYENILNSIQSIKITELCQSSSNSNECFGNSQLMQDQIIYIKLLNIRNQINVDTQLFSAMNIQISTMTLLNEIISYGIPAKVLDLTTVLSENINEISLSVSDKTTGIISTSYQFTITPTIQINSEDLGGRLSIDFPANEFQLSESLSQCIAKIGNNIVTCQISNFSAPQIFVTHNIAPSQTRNKIWEVQIDGVRNPYSIKPSSQMVIQSLYNSSQPSEIWKTSITMSNPHTLACEIFRNDTTINNYISLTFYYMLQNKIDQLNSFKIVIPSTEAVFSAGNQLKLYRTSINQTNLPQRFSISYFIQEITTNNVQYTEISFNDPICDPSCNSGSNLTYSIETGVTNPNSTQNTALSVDSKTLDSDDYLIQQKNNNLFILPQLTFGKIILKSSSVENTITGALNSITFLFTNQNPINQNSLYELDFLEQALFIPSDISFIKVFVNGVENKQFIITQGTSDYGNFIDKISINKLCSETNQQCTILRDYQIRIVNFVNAPAVFSDRSIQVFVSTIDDKAFVLDSLSTSPIPNILPSVSAQMNQFSVIRSNLVVDQDIDYLEIQFENINKMKKPFLAHLTLSASEIKNQISTFSNIIGIECVQININGDGSESPIGCQSSVAKQIFEIKFTNMCQFSTLPNICEGEKKRKIRIKNLKNPNFIQNVQSVVKLNFTTQEKFIYQELQSGFYLPKLSPIELTSFLIDNSLNPIFGQKNTIIFDLILSSQVVQNSVFTITFPDNLFYLPLNEINNIKFQFQQDGNSLQNPKFSYNFTQNNEEYLQILNFISQPNFSFVQGQRLTFSVDIFNRETYEIDAQTNSFLTIVSKNSDGQVVIQDQVAYSSLAKLKGINIPNSIVSITRNDTSLSSLISVMLSLTLPSSLKENTLIQIIMPQSEISIGKISDIKCPLITGISCQDSTPVVQTAETYIINLIQNQCKTRCAFSTTYSLSISGSLSNRNEQLIPQTSCQLKIIDPTTLVVIHSTSLDSQVLLKPELKVESGLSVFSILRSNSKIGEFSGIQININIEKNLNTFNALYINIPESNQFLALETTQNFVVTLSQYNFLLDTMIKIQLLVPQSKTTSTPHLQDSSYNIIRSITIEKVCDYIDCQSTVVDLTVIFENIYNPLFIDQNQLSQLVSANLIYFYLLSTPNTVIQEATFSDQQITPQLVGQEIQVTQLERTKQDLAVDSELLVQATLVDSINSDLGSLLIEIPLSQFSQPASLSSISCLNVAKSLQNMNCVVESLIDRLWLKFDTPCKKGEFSCEKNQKFAIQITGLSNPSQIISPLTLASQSSLTTSSIKFHLQNKQKIEFSVQTGLAILPRLASSDFQSLLIIRENFKTGQFSEFQITFITHPNQQIPESSVIIVSFPRFVLFNYNSTLPVCQSQSNTGVPTVWTTRDCIFNYHNTLSNEIIGLQISNFCTSPFKTDCAGSSSGVTFSIQFKAFNSYFTTDRLTNKVVAVQVILNGFVLYYSETDALNGLKSLVKNEIKLSQFLSNSTKVCDAYISLNLKLLLSSGFNGIYQSPTLPTTRYLFVEIPQSMISIYSSSKVKCTANNQNLNAISPPVTLLCESFENKVQVSISDPKQIVQINLTNLNNPQYNITLPVTDDFKVYLNGYDEEGNINDIQSMNSKTNYAVTNLSSFKEMKIIRDSNTLGKKILATFSLTTSTFLSRADIIQLDFSQGLDFTIIKGAQPKCTNLIDSSNLPCSLINTPIQILEISGICQKADLCEVGTKFQFSIESLFQNREFVPNDKIPNSNNRVSVVNQIDQNNFKELSPQNVFATPILIPNTLNQPLFSLSSYTSQNPVLMTFRFSINKSFFQVFPASAIITFSRNVFLENLKEGPQQIYCTINDVQKPCSPSFYTANNGFERDLNAIEIIDFASYSDNFPPSSSSSAADEIQITLTVSGLQNIYNQLDLVNGNIQVDFGVKVSSFLCLGTTGQFQLSSLLTRNLDPQNSIINRVRATPPISGNQTTIDVEFQTFANILPMSVIQIKFRGKVGNNKAIQKTNIQNCAEILIMKMDFLCTLSFGLPNDSSSEYTVILELENSAILPSAVFLIKMKHIQFLVADTIKLIYFEIKSKTSTLPYIVSNLSTQQTITFIIFSPNQIVSCPSDGSKCELCALDDPGQCVSCKVPGDYPILKSPPGECSTSCSTGEIFIEIPDHTTELSSSTFECVKCHSTCADCFNTLENGCLGCKQGLFFVDGRCETQCPKGTIKNSKNECQQSKPLTCQGECETCSLSLDFCLSCHSGFSLDVSGQCIQSKCNLSAFFIDQTTNKCLPCATSCQTCVGKADTCQTCRNNLIGPSFTTSEGNCQSCDLTCGSCNSEGPKGCESCVPTSKFNLLQQNQCVDKCSPGFYPNSLTQKCENLNLSKECNPKLCFQCQDSLCVECLSQYLLYNGSCSNNCPSDVPFIEGSPTNFKGINDNSTNANDTSTSKNSNNSTTSEQGEHVGGGGICVQQCQKFVLSDLNKCVSTCPSQMPYFLQNQCLSACPDKYILSSADSQECLFQCESERCSQCDQSDSSVCLQCKKGFELQFSNSQLNSTQSCFPIQLLTNFTCSQDSIINEISDNSCVSVSYINFLRTCISVTVVLVAISIFWSLLTFLKSRALMRSIQLVANFLNCTENFAKICLLFAIVEDNGLFLFGFTGSLLFLKSFLGTYSKLFLFDIYVGETNFYKKFQMKKQRYDVLLGTASLFCGNSVFLALQKNPIGLDSLQFDKLHQFYSKIMDLNQICLLCNLPQILISLTCVSLYFQRGDILAIAVLNVFMNLISQIFGWIQFYLHHKSVNQISIVEKQSLQQSSTNQ